MEEEKRVGKPEELSRFKQMIEASGEEVYLVKPDGELAYVNEAAAKSLGYTVDELLRMGVADFDPHWGPRFPIHFEDVKRGDPRTVETCHIRRDGRKIFKEMKSVYLNIEGSEYVCGFGRDITRKKEAEDALRAKTEELDRYFMSSLDLLCMASTDGYFIRLNPEWEKTLGYSLSELEGRSFIDFVHPEDVASTLETTALLKDQKQVLNFVNRYRRKDGSYRFIEWRSYPEGRNIWAAARDVTERREIEEHLRASEEKLRSIFRVAPAGIGLVLNRVIMEANDKLCEMTGYTKEELLGQNASMLYPTEEEYLHVGNEKYRQISQRGTGTVETRWKRKDGGTIHVILSSTPLDVKDLSKGITYTALDITERKEAEEALQFTRFAIDHQADATLWTTADSRFYYVNDTACRVLGYSREALLEMKVGDIDPDYTEDGWLARWQELKSKGSLIFESVHKTSDGRLIPVEMQTNFVEFGGREYNCALARDITERKRVEEERITMERRLFYAQKLESLGVLAGGIAHDFNNLLMAILGNLELALMSMPEVSPVRSRIEKAVRATDLATDLTRQMLAYSGKGSFLMRNMDVNPLILENVDLYRASVSRNATIDLRLEQNLPAIRADGGQVRQIVMNLITNASEAMEGRSGVITLSTSAMDCDDELLSRSRVEEKPRAGMFVCLEVEDSGCGMSPDVQERLFDPFFSTKFTGRGLGMCVAQGIVRSHKGAILVKSVVGRGTKVSVLFPVAQKSVETGFPAQSGRAVKAPRKRGASDERMVLLADDEEMVRTVCASMLGALGYRVMTAQDGKDAVGVFREHAGEVDCVLLDLSMPEMNGLEAFEEMLLIRPDIKVVLVSGYSEQDVMGRFSGMGIAGFIKKPYVLETLRKGLEEVFSDPR